MIRRYKRAGTKQRGVTLIELLVVGVLASILLALVFPSIHAGMGTLELRSAAQHLAAAAKFARDEAIYRQRPLELEIDTGAGTVAVIDSKGVGRSFQLPSGVLVYTIPPQGTGATSKTLRFLFTPDGSSVPFRVLLENARRRMEVATDPLTGFPRISDLKPSEL